MRHVDSGMMSQDPIDPETLAAFIEGRLEPHERAALLERFARDPDAFEIFAEAAAAERELAGVGRDDARARGAVSGNAEKFRPLKHRNPWRYAIPLAAAAGIGALVIGKAVLRPRVEPLLLADASALLAAAGASTLESALGADWTEPAWTGTRGSPGALSDAQRAFRLGSRFAALSLAVAGGAPAAAQRVAIELRELLALVNGGAPLAARLASLVDGVRPGVSRPGNGAALREIGADIAALVPGEWVRTGVWVEQARLAARAGAVGWFTPAGPAIAEARSLSAALRADPVPTAQSAAMRLEAVLTTLAPGLDREGLAALVPALDAIAEESAGR